MDTDVGKDDVRPVGIETEEPGRIVWEHTGKSLKSPLLALTATGSVACGAIRVTVTG
jgi:hypothetical protein